MTVRQFLLLVAIGATLGWSGCKQKMEANERQDKQYIQYQQYNAIYADYAKLPLPVTQARLDSFLHLFPNDARAWAFYGNVLFKQQAMDSAEAAYRNVITCNPRYSTGYAALGALFLNTDKLDSASVYLQKALDNGDSSAFTRMNLALLCWQQGAPQQAIAFADSAAVKRDTATPVFVGLAYFYQKVSQYDKARLFYDKAFATTLKDTAGFGQVLRGEKKLKDYYRENNL